MSLATTFSQEFTEQSKGIWSRGQGYLYREFYGHHLLSLVALVSFVSSALLKHLPQGNLLNVCCSVRRAKGRSTPININALLILIIYNFL